MLLLALIGVTTAGCLGGDSVPTGAGGNGGTGNGPGSAGTSGGTAGTFGTGGNTGTAGTSGDAGTSGTAGTTGTGGGAGDAIGGNNGTGGVTGTAGTVGSGGSVGGSGVAGTVGTAGTTGSGGRGGTTGSAGASGRGGSTAGTTGTGGAAGAAGTTGGRGGSSGGSGGTTGTGGSTANFFPGGALRVDDPCSSLLGGNVCLHQGKTSDNGTPFSKMAQITVGGTPGTMYQVKIHIRGVTEPTHVQGGTPGTPANFITGGSAYADSVNEGQYQQWRLTTTVPNQHYYLNVFTEGLSHIVKLLDYTETIQIGGGSVVTLDVHDGNAHEISNTVNNPPLAPTGCPGSMSSGQFVQIDADSAQ
jgi:hypothetical protein